MFHASALGKGFVHIYTGDGKGKTTAALGLCLRAAGHGLRCKIIQFVKGNPDYGERQFAHRLAPEIELVQYGTQEFIIPGKTSAESIALAAQGAADAEASIASGHYQVIVLDEITVAIGLNLVALERVLNMIKSKPHGVELVLTGRDAPMELVKEADLVTEMLQIKHYYVQEVPPRAGIEV